MKTVYIIECSAGSWDSYHTWIGGIYTNEKSAEIAKNKLNLDAKIIRDNCPVKPTEDGITDYDILETLSEEDQQKYWEYFSKHTDEMEWNEATIRKYPLNVLINREY